MSAARRADAGHSAYDWRAEGCAGSMTVTRQNLDAMGHTVNVMCRPWALGTLAPACHLLVACQPSQQVSTTDIATRAVTVVTTTSIVGDLVARVGGDRVAVQALMGPGADPHLCKASEGTSRAWPRPICSSNHGRPSKEV